MDMNKGNEIPQENEISSLEVIEYYFIERPPRIQPQLPSEKIEIPNPPDHQQNGLMRLLQLGLPLITILGVLFMSSTGAGRSPWMVVTMLLSVFASVGFGVYSYLQERRQQRNEEEDYRERLAVLTQEMHHSHEVQRYFYRYNYPDFQETVRIVETVLETAKEQSAALRTEARLWQRQPSDVDFGVVRIGIGTLPSRVIYTRQQANRGNELLSRLADKLAHDSRYVDNIPFVLKLRQEPEAAIADQEEEKEKNFLVDVPVVHSFGIAGENNDDVYRLARSVLADYLVFHSPNNAKLYVIAEKQEFWAWTQQLLHCQPDDQGEYLYFANTQEEESASQTFRFDEDHVDTLDTFTERLRSVLSQRKIRTQTKSEEQSTNTDPQLPFLLIVVDLLQIEQENDALTRLESDAAMSILLEEGCDLGAAVLYLANTRRQIPGACQAVIEVEKITEETNTPDTQYQKLIYRYAGIGINSLKTVGQAYGVRANEIRSLSNALRQLAPHEGYGANLTRSVPFLSFMGCKTIDELIDQAKEKWTLSTDKNQSGWLRSKFCMVLGNKPRSLIFSADKDGVHGMIAGSTGSGKSEMLISMLMSMAATYSPSVLNFVLVDFKGGTAFQEFRDLPHCVDVITNLGIEGVDRMFASISAELNQRQRLNVETNTSNIVVYRKQGLHLTYKPYPFLFIIIDEFAEMMSKNPDFKYQLESITRTGRAQGVHLLLAAQRPSGVTDQMRSNMKFRICLRVESPGDSREILRRSEAAFLPNGLPGRGYLQVGNDELELIQVAYTGDKVLEKRNEENQNTPAKSVMLYQELIRRLQQAAIEQQIPQQYAPWPAFLPPQLLLNNVLVSTNPDNEPITSTRYLERIGYVSHLGVPDTTLYLSPALICWQAGLSGWIDQPDWEQYALCPAFGLVDDPSAAKQYPLIINMRRGHAVIIGSPGWGKTTLLHTWAVSLLSSYSPRHLHLYILDLGGRGLNVFKEFPQVGAVISPDEEGYRERVQQLIQDLNEVADERKLLLDQAHAEDVYRYNERNADKPLPIIMVFLDNFTEFKETFGETKDSVETVLDKLTILMRRSKTFGIHFALTATQPGLFSNQLYNLCSERLTLRLTDPSLYRDVVGHSVIQFGDIPGRGYIQMDNRALSMQVALAVKPYESTDINEVIDPIHALAEQMQNHLRNNPMDYPPLLPIGALPHTIPFYQLVERGYGIKFSNNWQNQLNHLMREQWKMNIWANPARWLVTTFGVVAGNRLRPLQLSADGDGVHGIVAGGTGSGKSALLMTFIANMAVQYDPSMLNFVLIDYKGGGTFKPFEKLPHCVEVVTNLNKGAVRRMFTAVRAEMERRQELNTQQGVQDIVQYRIQGLHHQKPYPHLLIIIDEYAEMITDSPDFQQELDSITRLGRALGVHLVLASQKPVGVTDQMRANIMLRICLRVEGADTSRELLRRSDAAALPRIGGRGYLQVGNDEISLMQVAFLGSKVPTTNVDGEAEPSFLESIISQAQELTGYQQALAPWPRPLPSHLPVNYEMEPHYLENDDQKDTAYLLQPELSAWIEGVGQWSTPNWLHDAMNITVGLLDDLIRAKQIPLKLNLPKSHVVLFSAPGWGKTSFLRTLILSATALHSPNALHVYAIDLGRRELASLRPLPHMGPIIMPDEEGFAERVQQMLRDLNQIIEERKVLFDGLDLYRFNDRAQSEKKMTHPAILVAIDNFGQFVELFESLSTADGKETMLEAFITLVERSRAYGVHFVVTANRPSVMSRKLYTLFGERLTLRLSDSGDYTEAVGRLLDEPDTIPGRGYIKKGRQALEFQVALLPDALNSATDGGDDTEQIKQIAASMVNCLQTQTITYTKPLQIDPLSRSLSYRQMLAQSFQFDPYKSFVYQLKQLIAQQWQTHRTQEKANWLQVLIGTASGNRPRILSFEAQKDGAHGMVAGGTGSGKSELLTTLISGLAVIYPPDILNFVLVDYKGGGAFKAFENLPHCVDMVTNLDKSEVDRMFTAINAEIKRRQALNAETGTKDIIAYRKLGLHRTREPYPHLFIIIDEFAEMIETTPEYGETLNSITRTGRAQGVHLLLAAQQPKGVSGQMRANIRLRLCLRVEERDTSLEMLGRPDAAQLPSIPGRGYLQIGQRSIELIQVAWTGEDVVDDRPVEFLPSQQLDTSNLDSDPNETPKLYDRVVQLAQEVTTEQNILVRKPWPSFLPRLYSLESILYNTQHNHAFKLSPEITRWIQNETFGIWSSPPWSKNNLPCAIGLVDDPWQAKQEPFVLNLGQGHIAIFGESGSGKTSLLRTIIISAAATYSPADFHLYVIDRGGRNFRQIEKLPHMGAVLYSDDETFFERQQSLFQFLQRTIRERQQLLGEQGMDIYQYNNLHPERALPVMVLMIDNFIEFYENSQDIIESYLVPLLRRSTGLGITLICTSNTLAGVPAWLYNTFGDWLTLRQSNPDTYFDILGRRVPELSDIPGRGYLRRSGQRPLLFQIALPNGHVNVGEIDPLHQMNALNRMIEHMKQFVTDDLHKSIVLPRSIQPLPLTPALMDTLENIEKPSSTKELQAIVGISQESTPASLSLSRTSPHWRITGPVRSGKTTALYNIVLSLAHRYSPQQVGFVFIDLSENFVVCGGEVSLLELPHTLDNTSEIGKLPAILQRIETLLTKTDDRPAIIFVIDDYDDFNEQLSRAYDLQEKLAALLKRHSRNRFHVVAAGAFNGVSGSFYQRLRTSGCGIALRDDESVQRLGVNFSTPKGRKKELPVGRGYLVKPGQISLIQLGVLNQSTLSDLANEDEFAAILDQWILGICNQWPEKFEFVDEFQGEVESKTDAFKQTEQPQFMGANINPDFINAMSSEEQLRSLVQVDTTQSDFHQELQLCVQFMAYSMLAPVDGQLSDSQNFTGDDLKNILTYWEDSERLTDHVMRELATRYFGQDITSGLTAKEAVELVSTKLQEMVLALENEAISDNQESPLPSN